MKINEDDMVELKKGRFAKEGQIAVVLEILTNPHLGYLVEDIDYDEKPVDYPAAYPVEPEEIKRVLSDDEATKISDSFSEKRELEFA